MNSSFKGWRFVALAVLSLAGCGDYVDTSYGTHDRESVNGIDVLVRMFTASGHKVRTIRRKLSPKIQERADAIVWVPDSYHLPTSAERTWLVNDWLAKRSGRTLIYVGRDYDAGPEYWERMLEGAPADKVGELSRRKAEAAAEATARQRARPTQWECDWGRLVPFDRPDAPQGKPPAKNANPSDPQRLMGEAAWTSGVDPAKLRVSLASKLDPAFDADIVLGLDGNALVTRQRVSTPDGGSSQLIMVVNGSFLLNMPMVDREHRKLAAQLVREIVSPQMLPPDLPGEASDASSAAKPAKQVYLLESDEQGLQLNEDDAPPEIPESQMWPPERLRTTFLHLAVLGIILIVSRWPIFGRPREERATHVSDFGRHVEALGDLMARGGNEVDASYRLERYQHAVQSDAKRASRKA